MITRARCGHGCQVTFMPAALLTEHGRSCLDQPCSGGLQSHKAMQCRICQTRSLKKWRPAGPPAG